MANEIKKLTFVCPKCGDNRLEIIETDAIVSSNIISLPEDGDFEYENLTVDDSTIDRFQCFNCGYTLKDKKGNNITDNLEVVKWLKKHQKKMRR